MPCTTLTSHHGGINRRHSGWAQSRADKVESFTFYTYKVYIREAENLLVFLHQMADKLPITIISAVQNLSANKLIVNLCKLHYIHRFTYNETCIVHCASVHSLFCCHGDSVLQNLSYPRVSVVMVMPVSLLGGGRHWSVLNYGCWIVDWHHPSSNTRICNQIVMVIRPGHRRNYLTFRRQGAVCPLATHHDTGRYTARHITVSAQPILCILLRVLHQTCKRSLTKYTCKLSQSA